MWAHRLRRSSWRRNRCRMIRSCSLPLRQRLSPNPPALTASQSEATFADLQYGPAVLIGLANNDWTERLVRKLRFTLEHRSPGKLVLRDSNNPAREDWAVDYRMPYLSVNRDYALVVRVLDP